MSAAEDLLRFYGITETKKPADPTDIDSKDFQADLYFNSLIKKQNLSELSAKRKKVADEIKSFDSELQSIVYDNYTKFLQASDTIKSMKGGLSELSSKVNNLMEGLKNVQTESTLVREDLDPNRKKISRLCRITRLLERVDFISHLPDRLKQYVDIENYADAVDDWLLAEPILSSQNQYKSFTEIREQCEHIIKDLSTRVEIKMLEESTSSKESIKCALTLLKLKTPPDTILPNLTDTRRKVALSAIQEASSKVPSIQSSNSSEIASNIFELINQLHQCVVIDATEFVKGYQSSLLQYSKLVEDKSKREEPMDAGLQKFRSELFSSLLRTLSLESVCKLSCEDFSKFLSIFLTTIGTIGLFSEQQSFSLWIMKKFITAKLAPAKTKSLDAVCGIYAKQTTDSKLLPEEINGNENNNNEEKDKQKLKESSKPDYEIAAETFSNCIRAALTDLDVIASTQNDSRFLIQKALASMITTLINELGSVDPRFTLTAFGFSNLLSTKLIHDAFKQAARFDKDSPFLQIEEKLCEESSKTAQACLSKFVEDKRKLLSGFITDGMITTDWLNKKTPYDVSPSIAIVLQALGSIWGQVSSILGDSESRSSHNSSVSPRQRSAFSGYSGSAFNTNVAPMFHGLRDDNEASEMISQIDRLFTNVNRLHLSKIPSFNGKSVLSSIVIYTMKTFMELVRASVFNCAGFNQLQVDAYFIYGTLFDKVNDVQLFVALIDEMLSSAAERTIDPIPTKTSVLQDIFVRSSQKPTFDANNGTEGPV